jgi:hypothetical protein
MNPGGAERIEADWEFFRAARVGVARLTTGDNKTAHTD